MKIIFCRLGFLCMLFVISAVHADGGTVSGHRGKVYIERAGTQLRLVPDAPQSVLPGDTLVSERDGHVQWKMQDDSIFSMLSESSFKVDEFSTGSNPRAIFSLLKGGFRTLTGLISKRSGDIYRVNTPVATLGVRGTRYIAVFCKGDCDRYIPEKGERAKVRDGLYVKVEEGTVIIRNSKGALEVKAGQVAFVATDGSAPVIADDRLAVSIDFTKISFELQFTGGVVLPVPNPPRIEPLNLPPRALPCAQIPPPPECMSPS